MISSTPDNINYHLMLGNLPGLSDYEKSHINSAMSGGVSQDGISNNIDQYINPGTINGFVNQADQSISPYYDALTRKTSNSLNNYNENDLANYQNTINSLNQGLQDDVSTLNDKEGQNGTWGSSARAERLGSLGAKYNTSYNTAYKNATNPLNTQMSNGESLLGRGALPQVNLSQYNTSTNRAGNNLTPTQVGSYKYNPFGGEGSIGLEREANSNKIGRANLSKQLFTPFKGINQ